MIYAISGAQGSGKSTILDQLGMLGHEVVKRKSARSILLENDWTLNEVYADPNKMVIFQTKVLERKINDEEQHVNTTTPIFTERTCADVFTYTTLILGSNNGCSEWLDHYYNMCAEHTKKYAKIFYLENGLFDVEDDGVRGSNNHYSTLVNSAMIKFTEQMSSNVVYIGTADLNHRINIILDQI